MKFDGDDLVLCCSVVLVLLGLFGSIMRVNLSDNDTMRAMVAAGADPVAARCAVKSDTSPVCILYTASTHRSVD